MRALAIALWLSVIVVPVGLIALGEYNREAMRACQLTQSFDTCAAALK